MSWKTNPIMEWSDNNGLTWNLITDHSRSPLNVTVERIESKNRMADGSLRKYVVSKKRTWQVDWDNVPSKDVPLLTNGESGEWMQEFHDTHDGEFLMRLRDGSANGVTPSASNSEVVRVMFSDFSKDVVKRTPQFDLWNISLTLEEV